MTIEVFKSRPDDSVTSDLDKGVGQSDVQQNVSDHVDEGISKKEEIKREEGVSESDIMMQSECSHEI